MRGNLLIAYGAGQLGHRIRIERAEESTSGSGEVTQDWDNAEIIGERWAALRLGPSREVDAARQIVAETDALFQIRGRLAVEERMRVFHTGDGRIFDILGVQSDDGKAPANANWLFLFCRQGARQGS